MEEIKLPFESNLFQEAWNEWLEYRKQKKIKKYVPIGLKKTFTHLVAISNNDEGTAIAIINQSIEQSYQGLFPLKKNNTYVRDQINARSTSTATNKYQPQGTGGY